MVLPTIFSAHAPAAQHRARRQAAGIAAPAVTLSPLDAFLLTRLAAFLPHPLTVVDFAAAATDGDSAAILHAAEIPVIAPRIERMDPTPRGDSRASMRESRNGTHSGEAISATVPLTVQVRNAPVTDSMDDWDAVIRTLPRGETALVLLAKTAATATHTGEHLAWLAERVPDAPILLLPLGATGTGEVLAQAIQACPPGGTRRLVALREQAPFFATSELGLVFSADNAMMTVVLERLVAMMTGNFQFLPLVRDAVQAASHITAIEAELTRVQATLAQVQATLAQAQVVQVQPEAASTPTETALEAAHAHLEQEFAEKTRYAEWLESRLNHLEGEYIPWKNTVLAGLENEVRNLYASKILRIERLLRRVLRRG